MTRTDPMQQFREALDAMLSEWVNGEGDPDDVVYKETRAAVEALHAEALDQWGQMRAERNDLQSKLNHANDERAALAQQGGVKVPTEWPKSNPYGHGWNACRAEVLRLNAARPADQDAVDAARYRRLRSKAREVSSWDREGEAGRWSINFFSKRKTMTFDQSVDALAQPEKGT